MSVAPVAKESASPMVRHPADSTQKIKGIALTAEKVGWVKQHIPGNVLTACVGDDSSKWLEPGSSEYVSPWAITSFEPSDALSSGSWMHITEKFTSLEKVRSVFALFTVTRDQAALTFFVNQKVSGIGFNIIKFTLFFKNGLIQEQRPANVQDQGDYALYFVRGMVNGGNPSLLPDHYRPAPSVTLTVTK